MTTPAIYDPATPMGELSPSQLARFALRSWQLTADRIHDLHTEWEKWSTTHDQCGHPIPTPADYRPLEQPVRAWTQRHRDYVDSITRAQRELATWLLLARTACDVARLPEGEPDAEPLSLAGYELSTARMWLQDMRAAGESGDAPVMPYSAAGRWRAMTPENRAIMTDLFESMLADLSVADIQVTAEWCSCGTSADEFRHTQCPLCLKMRR